MKDCVEVKDNLLMMLNEAATLNDLLDVCKTLDTIFTHTEGLWVELRYAYKVVEIADRAKKALESFLVDVIHHKTKKCINTAINHMAALSERYCFLQRLIDHEAK